MLRLQASGVSCKTHASAERSPASPLPEAVSGPPIFAARSLAARSGARPRIKLVTVRLGTRRGLAGRAQLQRPLPLALQREERSHAQPASSGRRFRLGADRRPSRPAAGESDRLAGDDKSPAADRIQCLTFAAIGADRSVHRLQGLDHHERCAPDRPAQAGESPAFLVQ